MGAISQEGYWYARKGAKGATKMTQKLRNISYETRLNECGLTTLETRRLRGDQIEVFRILNGYKILTDIFSRLRKRGGLEDMELH